MRESGSGREDMTCEHATARQWSTLLRVDDGDLPRTGHDCDRCAGLRLRHLAGASGGSLHFYFSRSHRL